MISLTPLWPNGIQRLPPRIILARLAEEYERLIAYFIDSKGACHARFRIDTLHGNEIVEEPMVLLAFEVVFADCTVYALTKPYEQNPQDLVNMVAQHLGVPECFAEPRPSSRWETEVPWWIKSP